MDTTNQDSIYDELPDIYREQIKNNNKTLLDQEFIKLSQMCSIFNVNIDINDRKQIIDIIRKEVRFLAENNIMDYSILLGIEQIKLAHFHDIQNEPKSATSGSKLSSWNTNERRLV